MLRERLTRHPAPVLLRASVREALEPRAARPPWWTLWGAPAAAAIATALVMLLWIAPRLPSAPAGDPAQLVVRAVLAEHARNIFWGESRSDVVPAALPRAQHGHGHRRGAPEPAGALANLGQVRRGRDRDALDVEDDVPRRPPAVARRWWRSCVPP